MKEDYYEELRSLIKVWLLAISAICYCYLISIRISNGIKRLVSLLPIIALFSILPLALSTVHLIAFTFVYLTWLANFKLVLFALNKGPLASNPPLPFSTFISFALFPINPKKKSVNRVSRPSHKPILLACKVMIFAIGSGVFHQYKDNLHMSVILGLYCCYVYLLCELGFAITAFFVRLIFLGFDIEIERQFNEPYLATSLQNFWGRRWNLVVTSILHQSVFNPIRKISFPILGQMWSTLLAVFLTFVVSGLMHELLYVYVTRAWPTWEVTWLFVLYGVSLIVELSVKMTVKGRFRLHPAVSGPLTVVFVVVNMALLFLPQALRNGVGDKIIKESFVLVNLLRSKYE